MAKYTDITSLIRDIADEYLATLVQATQEWLGDVKDAYLNLVPDSWLELLSPNFLLSYLSQRVTPFLLTIATRFFDFVKDVIQAPGTATMQVLADRLIKALPTEWNQQVMTRQQAVGDCIRFIHTGSLEALDLTKPIGLILADKAKQAKLAIDLSHGRISALWKAMRITGFRVIMALLDVILMIYQVFAVAAFIGQAMWLARELRADQIFLPLSQAARRQKIRIRVNRRTKR